MDLQAYLNRINYTGALDPTLDTLKGLHRQHLFHVPFENLNIHMPRRIILDENLLFEKMVTENRGGFCFEQNGLFFWVLNQLGFDVIRIEANVHGDNGYSLPMTHMALIVTIDEVRYLTDVGFGASFIEPIEIDNPNIQSHENMDFQIVIAGDTAYYHNRIVGWDEMKIGYRFFFEAHALSDYVSACDYTQSSPNSHFTQKRVCSRWSETGRITLSDNNFIVTTWAGERTETPIRDEDHFHALLNEHFGIDVLTQPPRVQSQ